MWRAALLLAGIGLGTAAADPVAATITVRHAHARATVAAQPTGAGYLTLVNRGGADRLLAASAPVSAKVEMHRMTMDGGTMRMRRVDAIELPAGSTVVLEPGGLHLMFVGLKAPLKAGASFPLTLRFEKAGELVVPVETK